MVKKQTFIENINTIDEVAIELTTGEVGMATYITEKINGILECIIIETSAPINLLISSADIDGLIIFNTKNSAIDGVKYLSLSTYATTKQFEQVGYSSEKWVLNDKLRIEIVGAPNAEVKIKIRYK